MHAWRRVIKIVHLICFILMVQGMITYFGILIVPGFPLRYIEIMRSILSFESIANVICIIMCAIWGEE